MPEIQDDIATVAPQKLVGSFSKNRVVFCLFLAVVAHIVVIGGSSTEYIYYNWLNPEAGQEREAMRKAEIEAEEAEKEKLKEAEREKADAVALAGASNTVGEAEVATGGDNFVVLTNGVRVDLSNIPPEYRNSPEVLRTMQVAPSNEIPAAPDDLGISLDETNPM